MNKYICTYIYIYLLVYTYKYIHLGKSNKEEIKPKTPQQEQQQQLLGLIRHLGDNKSQGETYHEHLEIIQKTQQVSPQQRPQQKKLLQQNKLLQMLKKPQVTTETATEIQDKSRPQSEQSVQQLHQQQNQQQEEQQQLLKILQPQQQATQQGVPPSSAPTSAPVPSGHPPSISQPSITSSERRVALSELFKSQSLIDKDCSNRSVQPTQVSPNMHVITSADTAIAKKSTTVSTTVLAVESSSKSSPKSSTPTSVATAPNSVLKSDQNTPIAILQRPEAPRHHQSKAIPIPVHAPTLSPVLYPASPKLSPVESEKSVETREALFAIMRAKAASPVKFNSPFPPPSVSSSFSFDHIESRENLIMTPKGAPLVSPTPLISPPAVPTNTPISSLNAERSRLLTHTNSDNALLSLLSGMSSSTKGTASEKVRESPTMPILSSYPSEVIIVDTCTFRTFLIFVMQ
jgi:hypothetical protein